LWDNDDETPLRNRSAINKASTAAHAHAQCVHVAFHFASFRKQLHFYDALESALDFFSQSEQEKG
jgi:hypothetical protein